MEKSIRALMEKGRGPESTWKERAYSLPTDKRNAAIQVHTGERRISAQVSPTNVAQL